MISQNEYSGIYRKGGAMNLKFQFQHLRRFLVNTIIAAFIVVLGLSLQCTNASADVILYLDETFQSGATFTGQLTFSDSYDTLIAVTGVLTGSSFGPSPDPITWAWYKYNGQNSYSLGSGIYADFLMDGTPSSDDFEQFIEIDWRDAGGGNLVLDSTAGSAAWYDYGVTIANAINYTDPMTDYAFSNVGTVPEPSTFLLVGAGLMGVGLIRRKFKK